LSNSFPILCLSLPFRSEKLRRLQQRLELYHWSAVHFSAVVGKDLDFRMYKPIFQNSFYKHLKSNPKHMGHLGCLLSHIGMYRIIVDNHWDVTLILEDDAVLDSDFRTKLGDRLARVNAIDPEWDLLLLGFSCSYDSYTKCHANDDHNLEWNYIAPVDYFMGTWAYVVNGTRAAQKILESMFPVTWCIDHHLCSLIKSKGLRVYGTLPSLAFHPGKWRISSWGYHYTEPFSHYKSDTNG